MQRNERRERRSQSIQDRERSGHSTARSVSAVMKPQKIPIRMKLKLMVLTAGQSLQTHAVQPCTVKTQKNGFNKIQGTSKLLMQTNASLCAGAHHRGRWWLACRWRQASSVKNWRPIAKAHEDSGRAGVTFSHPLLCTHNPPTRSRLPSPFWDTSDIPKCW